MKSREELTLEIINKYFLYLPKTGELLWKDRPGNPGGFNTRWANKVINSVDANGYITFKLNCPEFRGTLKAHQVVFFLETGEWLDVIDHEDRNRANNKYSNLRKSDKKRNALNQKVRSTNTTGHPNISMQKDKFVVQKSINGTRYFKRFDDLAEAIKYRDNLNKEAEQYVNSI